MDSAKTLLDLGWPEILEAWGQRCRTDSGRAAVAACQPFADSKQANTHVREVSEARTLEDRAQPMSFGGIQNVHTSVVRAHKGSRLEAEELVAIGHSAEGYHRLRHQLEVQQEAVPLLWQRASEIGDFESLYTTVNRAFDPSGRVADHASSLLDSLRRKIVRLQQNLESKAKSLLDDQQIAGELQDKYWTLREDRYVLPVKASSRSKVRGIVHGSSGSGQTVFVEPHALVELNNELKLAEYEEQEEVLRILSALSARVGQEADALREAAAVVVGLDCIGSAAKFANDLRAQPPAFCDKGAERTIDLRQAKHPLLLLSEKECIASDILVESGRILVISGPNAGGKTVTLKTVGLAVMMSRYGLHIATGEGSSLPWFDDVYSAIGDSQSLASELSTFSAHLVLLREFLTCANAGSLVLIDEICSATEPEQGGALAQSVMEHLAELRVMALVTTHYERLKGLAMDNDIFANASVGFDMDRMAPTFRLHLGIPGASAAIDVARRMEVPENVILRATELAGGGRAKLDELLQTVSDERERLADERHALEEERVATAAAYEEAMELQSAAEEKARKDHAKEHQGALVSLRETRRELEGIKEELKRSVKKRKKIDANSLQQQVRTVDTLAGKVAQNAPKRPPLPGKAPSTDALQVGVAVTVASLGRQGTVVEVPRRGGGANTVMVQIGSMKSKVRIDDLRLLSRGAQKAKATQGKAKSVSYQLSMNDEPEEESFRSPDTTLDLRGERADEAIARVDRFLDSSLLGGKEAIFIVHGHGTGALRTAVRGHLEGHPCVTKWRRGQSQEGGDGVTLAWLDS